MTLLYLDLETTGLDPNKHEVWEIGYAFDDDNVESFFVPHVGLSADPKALEVGRYVERGGAARATWDLWAESDLARSIDSNTTIVGANPRFDAAFLKARWGIEPWHYRLLDIQAYAMGALGYETPQGLLKTILDLQQIFSSTLAPRPDHTAAADVEAVRWAHKRLQDIYASNRP